MAASPGTAVLPTWWTATAAGPSAERSSAAVAPNRTGHWGS
nr:hypothetical protein [Rubrivirga marina]